MRKSLVVSFGLVSLAVSSQANVLDFGNWPDTPSICSSTIDGLGSATACADWSYLLQSYGDVAGAVDVSYGAPRTTDGRSLRWWSTNYNDLYGVLFSDGSHGRIDLQPLGGNAVTLTHFDLGAWSLTTRGTTVNVYEIGNSTPLYTFTGYVGAGMTHASFDLSLSSTAGLRIEWMDDAYNVGIDNVTFTVGTVPEPSTYALMLSGLALCAAVVRRRRG